MKSRNVVGKKIVAVRHDRYFSPYIGKMVSRVDALILDDGSEIRSHAIEEEYEPQGEMLYVSPPSSHKQRSDA